MSNTNEDTVIQGFLISFLWLIPVVFLINSCTTDTPSPQVKKIETVTQYIEKTPLNLEKPAAIEMSTINWILITPENSEQVFADLKSNGVDAVIFGVTDDGYETLSKNFAQIRSYIIKQNEIITQYKNYYESDSKP